MGSSPSKKEKDPDKEPVYKKGWFWAIIIIGFFLLALVGLAYYFHHYSNQGMKDHRVILKNRTELMDLYAQYWDATEKMKEVLDREDNNMTLEDLLNYLHRLDAKKVCKNKGYRSQIPELEEYCSGTEGNRFGNDLDSWRESD